MGELVSEDLSLGSSMERFTIDFTNQFGYGIDTGYYPIDDYYKYLGSKINLNKAKQVKNINKPVWH
jgi:hypothetical protein